MALETFYNGYRFRSRLEARWAVFFDAAGLRYRYEPEGYRLSDGTAYLPDFFLPELNIFAEIKAGRNLDDGKAERFARDYTDFDSDFGGVLVCYGDPYIMDLRFLSFCESDADGGGQFDTDAAMDVCSFLIDTDTGEPFLLIEAEKAELAFHNARRVNGLYYRPKHVDPFPIRVAAAKARQARFEHGEHGGRVC